MTSRSTRIYVARSGASATASATVALTAATARTVVAVLGGTGDTLGLSRVRVSFDSVTATNVPAVVEVGVVSTLGTMTAFTPVQTAGRTQASSATAGYNATVEPTYTRIFDTTYMPVNNGVFEFWYPLGMEPQCDASQGFAIRVTSPSAVNCYASLLYTE